MRRLVPRFVAVPLRRELHAAAGALSSGSSPLPSTRGQRRRRGAALPPPLHVPRARGLFLTSMVLQTALDAAVLSTCAAGLRRGVGIDVQAMVPTPSNVYLRSGLRGFFWMGESIVDKGTQLMRDRYESDVDSKHRKAEEAKERRRAKRAAERKL
jgi:hypothetical protein